MQLLETKGIAKEKFFKDIGSSSSNFRAANAKTPLNSDTISNILTQIPDVNLEWLITGNGKMLNTDSPKTATPPSNDAVMMSREVFDLLSRQTETIQSQQRTIEALSQRVPVTALDGVAKMAAGE